MAGLTVEEEKGKEQSKEESREDHGENISVNTLCAEGGQKDPRSRTEGSGSPSDAGRGGAPLTSEAGSQPSGATSTPRRPS